MNKNLIQLEQFRYRLYHTLPQRADATMDLIDALAANTTARSVVELSLSTHFRRRHASVHDAVDAFLTAGHSPFDGPRRRTEKELRRALMEELPAPSERPFWLLALGVCRWRDPTPTPCPIAATSTGQVPVARARR